MTAPSLPETLRALAQLLPERVRVEMAGDESEAWVYRYEARYQGWQTVWWGGDNPAPGELGALEYALREECDARGWALDQQSCPHPVHPSWRATIYTPQFRSAQGSSPAEALALALLGALGGEGA